MIVSFDSIYSDDAAATLLLTACSNNNNKKRDNQESTDVSYFLLALRCTSHMYQREYNISCTVCDESIEQQREPIYSKCVGCRYDDRRLFFFYYFFLYRHARTDTQNRRPNWPTGPSFYSDRHTTFAFSYTRVIVELMVPLLLLLVGWTIIKCSEKKRGINSYDEWRMTSKAIWWWWVGSVVHPLMVIWPPQQQQHLELSCFSG